jgi:hypothetical protein
VYSRYGLQGHLQASKSATFQQAPLLVLLAATVLTSGTVVTALLSLVTQTEEIVRMSTETGRSFANNTQGVCCDQVDVQHWRR